MHGSQPSPRALTGALAAAALLAAAPAAHGMGRPATAALQVALKARGHYDGTIHGVTTRGTRAAIRSFQRRHRLEVDGIAGPRTRAALGAYARHTLGERLVRIGLRGWDVAALQFLLAWHGFPSGTLDGRFGPRTERALLRYQRWSRLARDGVAGPVTIRALRSSPPPRVRGALRRPVRAPAGDRFGPRGSRFHAGVDFTAGAGARVRAARGGTVAFAGRRRGGFGRLVVVRHGRGVRTLYAHLSRFGVREGRRVRAGTTLGRVGSSGFATGPHLHFELRLRGAAANPLPALR
ncbi:MAG TPA: peptidoglycan-binding protein [Gaiellaceae bacterium]|nr:peptidoglycan-binding protein [Gaiellaceae bacterium]